MKSEGAAPRRSPRLLPQSPNEQASALRPEPEVRGFSGIEIGASFVGFLV
jgi:hypothetical protein